MTKPIAVSTLSPLALGVGAEVIAEDALEVLGQLNWSFQKRSRTHLAATTAIDDWNGTGEIGTTRTKFPAANVYSERLRFRIKVRPEVDEVEFGVSCFFDASNEGDVELDFGGGSIVIHATSADNGSLVTQTIATSTIGTGDLDCVLSLKRSTGSSANNFLESFIVRDVELSTLPDPGTD